MRDYSCHLCGFKYNHEALGKYGCPNCHGEGLKPTHGGRRPGAGAKPGVRLKCGECGQPLTAREWIRHFAACPKRPAA